MRFDIQIAGDCGRSIEIAGDLSRFREIVGDFARYNRIYFDSGADRFDRGDVHTAWGRHEAMRELHTAPYSVQMQST